MEAALPTSIMAFQVHLCPNKSYFCEFLSQKDVAYQKSLTEYVSIVTSLVPRAIKESRLRKYSYLILFAIYHLADSM